MEAVELHDKYRADIKKWRIEIMETLDLKEAATFLKMNPEVLRRKAKSQKVPSRKAGKRWIFIKEHLADWVSGRYPEHGQGLRVIDDGKKPEEYNICQSTHAEKLGGFNSPHQTAGEYNALLGLK